MCYYCPRGAKRRQRRWGALPPHYPVIPAERSDASAVGGRYPRHTRGAKRRQRRWGALPPLKGPCRFLHHQRFRQKHRHPVEEFHLGKTLHMRDNGRLGVDEVRGIDAK